MNRIFRLYLTMILLGIGFIPKAASSAPLANRLLPLEVVVNGAKSGTWLLLERDSALYATHDAFDEWRVQFDPDTPHISHKGQDYWPLAAIPGYKSRIDPPTQSLQLIFSPEAFATTRLKRELTKKTAVSPVLSSLFFNYDLSYTHLAPRNSDSTADLGMVSELGISTGLGVLTSSTMSRNLLEDRLLGERRIFRLETTFTQDFPEKNFTLRLGDAGTKAGILGRSVYFGGIQFGTNFSLTPGYASQPTPALSGISAAPSTIELYINDVLRQVSNVPAGPFAIDSLTGLTGNGEARMVVRDLLGRETVIVQSFFSSSQLLAKGLNDWSLEAGSVRQDLGISSGRYGPAFIGGTWRHGYSNSLTLQGRAEMATRIRTLELGAISELPWQVLGSFSATSSHEDLLGQGTEWLAGLESRDARNSFFIQAKGASENFRQLGQGNENKSAKRQLAANWNYHSPKWGTVGLGIVSVHNFNSPRVDTYSATYSVPLWGRSTLNFTANHVKSNVETTFIGTTLVIPMGSTRLATVTANHRENDSDLYATMTQTPTYENRLGWRVLAGKERNHEREDIGLNYLGNHGFLTGELSHTPEQQSTRVSANGGLLMADGHLFATERVSSSFALAEIPGYGNVGVGIGNNASNKTNNNGIALVPNLSAYQNNSIRLNPRDLPVAAEIDNIEQQVVPAWRSGVKVLFPVRSGRGALLKIMLDDGEVAPAGSILHIKGDSQEFYVARRGEAFVTGLQPSTQLVMIWNQQECNLDVQLPPETVDEIPRLPSMVCHGVTR